MEKRQKTTSRSARILMVGLLSLLPFLGLAAWNWMLMLSEKNGQLSRIIEGYGYVAVTPPSRLFGPGTITTVETLPDGTMQLHQTCRMDEDALSAMWQKSKTLNKRSVAKVKHTLNSSADLVEVVISRANGERVQLLDMSLKDISIVTMSHEDLISVRTQYLKGSCEEAIIWNLEAGSEVCQPEEVLQADVVYRTESRDRLEAGATLKSKVQSTGWTNIAQHLSEANDERGDDLFLGVKLRACFELADKDLKVASGDIGRVAGARKTHR